jgi:ADP-ribose pyrophosphatase
VSSPQSGVPETVWHGKYITVRRWGTWEYVGRTRGIHAAVILAVVNGDVLLVEQYRVPLGGPCLELPAGLVGDKEEGEEIEIAAARELEEETGYRPERIETVGRFASSPGMVSETFSLVRATGLTKVGEGGGEPGENITVHRVPIAQVPAFVASKRAQGMFIDVKLLVLLGAGLLD